MIVNNFEKKIVISLRAILSKITLLHAIVIPNVQ